MATKRAKILSDAQLQQVLDYIEVYSQCPESDHLKMLLSHRAGLRACEIAALTVEAATTPDGKIGKHINLFSHMTKNGKERQVPMHPDIADAIRVFRKAFPEARRFALGQANRYQSANAVTVWLWRIYRRVGLVGCSGHSGRRTCITRLAQQISVSGGSLRDLQLMAGHARLDTTEKYLEPSNRQAMMIALLGDKRLEFLHADEYQDPHIRKISQKAVEAITLRTRTGVNSNGPGAKPIRRPRPKKLGRVA